MLFYYKPNFLHPKNANYAEKRAKSVLNPAIVVLNLAKSVENPAESVGKSKNGVRKKTNDERKKINSVLAQIECPFRFSVMGISF